MPRSQWHAARRESFRAARPLPPVSVPLSEAVGRVAASDVTALCDVPHYASSAMDGWAVAGAPPWRLLDETGPASAPLESGQARTIVTGGLIPQDAVGVLRSEHGAVSTEDGVVLLDRNADARADEPAANEHVRPAGEEVTASDTIIHAGAVLNPAHIAVAAVCGHDELSVLPRPSVSLVLTGDEVV